MGSSNVRVITDSSAVMPRAWAESSGVHVLPLQVAWEDGEVVEGDLDFAGLTARLARGRPPPKTSAPSPGQYLELYAQLLATNDALLVVCPPAELSMTFSSATLAARDFADRVRVLDGRTAAGGQGLVAIEAARSAAEGDSLDAVLARASSVASRVQIWATLEQLEYLRRSGRVPAIAAIGAEALRLQPIVRYSGGTPSLAGVTRNAMRGTERVFSAWERSRDRGTRLHLLAFHSAREAEARDLRQRVIDRVGDAETEVVEVPASMGAHTGPGLLGLAWFWDN
ncbi:MAG: DegV family protein [Actinomycetota bacterium]